MKQIGLWRRIRVANDISRKFADSWGNVFWWDESAPADRLLYMDELIPWRLACAGRIEADLVTRLAARFMRRHGVRANVANWNAVVESICRQFRFHWKTLDSALVGGRLWKQHYRPMTPVEVSDKGWYGGALADWEYEERLEARLNRFRERWRARDWKRRINESDWEVNQLQRQCRQEGVKWTRLVSCESCGKIRGDGWFGVSGRRLPMSNRMWREGWVSYRRLCVGCWNKWRRIHERAVEVNEVQTQLNRIAKEIRYERKDQNHRRSA